MDVWKTVREAETFGVDTSEATFDWQKVQQRMDHWIGKFVSGKEPQLQKWGVDLLRGQAAFTSPNTIRVGDAEYQADRFLIGTGASAKKPDGIQGIDHAVTSKELFSWSSLPESMAIIGGGYIGMEFAHILNQAGVKVTLLQRGERLLKNEDAETSAYARDVTENQGVRIILHTDVKKIENHEDHMTVSYLAGDNSETLSVDTVLNAAGRVPNIRDLNLEKAGVDYRDDGIVVNACMQTSAPSVYAAGDSIGGYMLTPVATREAKTAVQNAFSKRLAKMDYSLVPHAIFTLPPVASVGLTEEKAQQHHVDYGVSKSDLGKNGTAILLDKNEGYVKILWDKNDGTIIGGHMVGAYADEIIYEIAIAMKGRLTVQDLADVTQVHPTFSETFFALAHQASSP